MKPLLLAAGLVLFVSCDSSGPRIFPTGPTTIPAPSPPMAGPPANRNERGPIRTNPTMLAPGATADVTVLVEDPICFPNWDSSGRCQQFEVSVANDGTLVASLTLPVPDRGFWNPEVFIAAPNGDWQRPDYGPTTNTASMQAHAGLVYLVVVISYGPFPDVVHLSVEARP